MQPSFTPHRGTTSNRQNEKKTSYVHKIADYYETALGVLKKEEEKAPT